MTRSVDLRQLRLLQGQLCVELRVRGLATDLIEAIDSTIDEERDKHGATAALALILGLLLSGQADREVR